MLKEKISKILDLQGKELKRLGFYTIVVLTSFAICLPFIGRGLKNHNNNLLNKQKSVAESVLAGEEERDSIVKVDSYQPIQNQLTAEEAENMENTEKKRNKESCPIHAEKEDAEEEVPAMKNMQEEERQEVAAAVNVELKEMVWPVKGEVLRQVGICYWQTFSDYRYHDGVDIKAERGTEVLAALQGKIVSVETSKDKAVKVVIDHGGGWQSVYAHLEISYLKEGQVVQTGEKIGRIGQPGSQEISIGPHLHFKLSKDEKIINPLDYLH